MRTGGTELQFAVRESLLNANADRLERPKVGGEIKSLLALSAPVTLQVSSQYAIHVISQSFIGHQHQGATELAAAAIGHTWFNVCWSFVEGASTALDTLGSQAYGTGRPQLVVSCCISAVLVLTLLCLPLTAAMLAANPVAQIVFKQTPEAAALVATFCKGLLPGAVPHIVSISILKGLQVQNRVWPPAFITIVSAAASIPINKVLIGAYGFQGAALSKSAARSLQCLLFCGYLACWSIFKGKPKGHAGAGTQSKPEVLLDTEVVGSAAAVKETTKLGLSHKLLADFLWLGVPGGVMQAANACSLDVTTVMTSRLGQSQVAAHSILQTITHLTFVAFPLGLSTAATIRVGNLVGGNNPSQARLAGFVAVALSVLSMLGLGLLLTWLRNHIGALFIHDQDIVARVAAVVPFCAIYLLMDAVGEASSGVLRAVGRQAWLMWYNILGFWVVGVALGYALTFRAGLGLAGIWLGTLTGASLVAVLCAWSLICIDWRHEADLARHRFSRQREEELEGDEEEQRQAAGSHTGYTSPDMQAVPDLPELAPSGSVTNLARKNESAIGQG